MKNNPYILFLTALVAIPAMVAAQQKKDTPRLTAQERYEQRLQEVEAYNAYVERYMNRDISHRLGAWGQIGYSSMQVSDFSTFHATSKGGVGGGLGVGYQMRYKTLLVQTGMEFQCYNSTFSLYADDKKNPTLTTSYAVQLTSPAGMVSGVATYYYTNTQERLLAGYLQIPLLIGMELIDHQMYFLIGPKVGLNILADSKMKTEASIHVEDLELIDPLSDMPTHNLIAQTMERKQKAAFATNLALSAEVGICLDKYYQPDPEIRQSRLTDVQKNLKNLHTRLAVFGEYGLININSNTYSNGWKIPFSELKTGDQIGLDQIQMCSSVETAGAESARIYPWMVGVKLTVMYDLPRKQLRTKPLPKAPQTPVVTTPEPVVTTPEPVVEPEPEFTYEEQTITKGMKIKVENLFFATNRTEVLPQSGPALEKLADFLKDNPSVHILLIGHTDSIGTERANQILSEGRVRSVKEELIRRGVEASRMAIEGRGESQPVDTNSTEEGRQNNRRVEFIITSVDEN